MPTVTATTCSSRSIGVTSTSFVEIHRWLGELFGVHKPMKYEPGEKIFRLIAYDVDTDGQWRGPHDPDLVARVLQDWAVGVIAEKLNITEISTPEGRAVVSFNA